MTKKHRNFTGSIAVLDVGSSKVSCFIARLEADGSIHVTGIGHQLSKGIRSGQVVDTVEAETSILSAVHTAEQMSGETIENVVVGLSGAGISSRHVTVELTVAGEGVTERDLAEIQEEGLASLANEGIEVLHCFPVSYTLDDVKNIRDPRGMLGEKLGAELHVIVVPVMLIRNMTQCLARCHLNAAEFIASAYVSGLASLEPDEMELGVTFVDMGGGTTNLAVFAGGKCLFADSIPIGGSHVTSDLARGLSTSISHAERLKTLHGSAVPIASDDQAMVDVPILGEEDSADSSNLMPRSMLVGIIRPRLEEVFEIIRSKVEVAGLDAVAGRRAVLTGGASQLIGVRELATRVLGKQVRLSKPRVLNGLADAVSGPAFSTSVGMLEYARRRSLERQMVMSSRNTIMPVSLSRLARWFRENF
jgi:cell division protein FtsA